MRAYDASQKRSRTMHRTSKPLWVLALATTLVGCVGETRTSPTPHSARHKSIKKTVALPSETPTTCTEQTYNTAFDRMYTPKDDLDMRVFGELVLTQQGMFNQGTQEEQPGTIRFYGTRCAMPDLAIMTRADGMSTYALLTGSPHYTQVKHYLDQHATVAPGY